MTIHRKNIQTTDNTITKAKQKYWTGEFPTARDDDRVVWTNLLLMISQSVTQTISHLREGGSEMVKRFLNDAVFKSNNTIFQLVNADP